MGKRQRIALLFGFLLFILMGIYPPWNFVRYDYITDPPKSESEELQRRRARRRGYGSAPTRVLHIPGSGYAPIFNPPGDRAWIDLSRLGVQWIVLGAVTGGAIVALRPKRRD